MRALVLAAGKGTRLGTLTSRTNKCLLNCGGRPIVDLVVSSLADLEVVSEVVMVVGHRADEVIQHFDDNPAEKPITFVHQDVQSGLVHAIESARPHVDDEEVMLLLGDEILQNARYQAFIDRFRQNELFAAIGSLPTTDAERVRKTYTFSHEGRRVQRLVEKPTTVLSPRMGTGTMLFSAGALSYTDITTPNPLRGEKDLVGVLQVMVDDGRAVEWFDVCDEFANVNTSGDLERARTLAHDDFALRDAG